MPIGKPDLSDVTIVAATEADLPGISALASEIWHACYPGIITVEQIEFMLAWMYSLDTMRREIQGGIRYLRMLVGNRLVGFASFGPAGEPAIFKLHKLYLHPSLHGEGLGTRFLRDCERQARALGARQLMLSVNKHNSRAIAAYHRNGFQVVDSVVAEIGGGFVMDDYIMAKELGEH